MFMESLAELSQKLEEKKREMGKIEGLPMIGPYTFVETLAMEVSNAVTRAFGEICKTTKDALTAWTSLSDEIGVNHARNYAVGQNVADPEAVRIAEEIGRLQAAVRIQQQIQRLQRETRDAA